jgi:type IV pilus assembly protein PilY1
MRYLRTLLSSGFGILLGLAAALPVHADDTEIFVGRSDNYSDPNVLFVIDTSGSMDTVTNFLAYDPATTYAGSCAASRIYWSDDGSTPDCATSNSWFNVSALVCNAAASALASEGYYRDRYASWHDVSGTSNDKWNNLAAAVKNEKVECRNDNGVHGDGSSPPKLYPADKSSGPWTTAGGSNKISWSNYSRHTLFSSNYLNYTIVEAARERTRLQVVKEVMHEVLAATSGINIGLMRFSSDGDGGYMLHPMSPIATDRDALLAAMDAQEADGNTPLSETLYEAGQYYAGRAVDFGLAATGNDNAAATSVAASRDGNTYVSPIGAQCQNQFIVLLTDGDPVEDTSANAKIAGLPGFQAATGQAACSGNCLDEMSAYLQNHDLDPELSEEQAVNVYTIGFASDQALLQTTADRGNGRYYTADNASDLTDAFVRIIDDVVTRNVTFTGPSVSVNTFNRLTHRSELYFAMFQPSNTARWPGNVKRYRLGSMNGTSTILDALGQPAVDDLTDTFVEGAKSYWTLGDPDGPDTTRGGYASRIRAARNVYTITGAGRTDVALATDANVVHEDNAAITQAMLGAGSTTDRTAILHWARGVDAEGNTLNILGDSLHSKPVVVSYGGSEENPDLTLYYTTNDGYLHAINPVAADDADLEVYSFIPPEMLPRLKTLMADDVVEDKQYGLDGPMTWHIAGDNGNHAVDAGEKLYLYFGERDGGRDYYAVETSNRAAPRLAWMIRGGAGDFAELGNSWSAMSPAVIRLNGDARNVLIFGGGYDKGQDAAGPSVADTMGRAIYMVDAVTGERLWWAANAADNPGASLPLEDMTHSIPSDLRVIDVNGDGYDDRIYVGDMGSKLWRFDIDNMDNTGASNLVTGGVIADFAGDDAAGNRRFYYPPSVSQIVDEHLGPFLTIAIGSGHRANPLGTPGKHVEDRFYMIRDTDVLGPPVDSDGTPTYSAITESDLLDVTENLDPSTEDLAGAHGWMIDLADKEKSLSGPLSADNRVFFTTYTPEGDDVASTCNASGAIGKALEYEVDILTGRPTLVDDPYAVPDDDEAPAGDPGCGYRCRETAGPIPPEPVLVFQDPNEDDDEENPNDPENNCDGIAKVSMVIGTQVTNPGICTAPVRTYWYAQQDQ